MTSLSALIVGHQHTPYSNAEKKEIKKELTQLYTVEKKTSKEIAIEAKVSKSTINSLLNKVGIPCRTPAEFLPTFHEKQENKRAIHLDPSPELAYLIGAKLGDGYVRYHYSYEFGLKVKDKDFAEQFFLCLKFIAPQHNIRFKPFQNRWRVDTASKRLYNFFSSTIPDDYTEIIDKYPAEFIRGLSDAEGGSYFTSNGKYRYAHVKIFNTDRHLLEFTNKLLITHYKIRSTIRISHIIPETNNICFLLEITNIIDLIAFEKNIGFSIQRKQNRLKINKAVYDKMILREELYNKTIELHNAGLGRRRIARILKISPACAFCWYTNKQKPLILQMKNREV